MKRIATLLFSLVAITLLTTSNTFAAETNSKMVQSNVQVDQCSTAKLAATQAQPLAAQPAVSLQQIAFAIRPLPLALPGNGRGKRFPMTTKTNACVPTGDPDKDPWICCNPDGGGCMIIMP